MWQRTVYSTCCIHLTVPRLLVESLLQFTVNQMICQWYPVWNLMRWIASPQCSHRDRQGSSVVECWCAGVQVSCLPCSGCWIVACWWERLKYRPTPYCSVFTLSYGGPERPIHLRRHMQHECVINSESNKQQNLTTSSPESEHIKMWQCIWKCYNNQINITPVG